VGYHLSFDKQRFVGRNTYEYGTAKTKYKYPTEKKGSVL
jgi:hypothetical protein